MRFESDTDTEVIAKLIKHLHEVYPKDSFFELVQKCTYQLEGAFACTFKSRKFPGQCVATRRGSPLLIGIKTESDLVHDSIPIQFRYEVINYLITCVVRKNIINLIFISVFYYAWY